MSIDIRKLTPDLLEDYLHFFETDAHADDPNEDRCYCVGWCSADHRTESGFSSPEKRRELAVQYINSGVLQGYLAYHEGKVVGWCNANTKADCISCAGWLRFMTAVEATPNTRIKSIYCFAIAPSMKRKGVASLLLQRVCEDAKADGFDFVEAYPNMDARNTSWDYAGHLELYKRNGFAVCQEVHDKYMEEYDINLYVVRKELR